MHLDTPSKLLHIAAALFAEKGYAAVSIREVAVATGLNSALISYHFGSKEGLYRAVLDQQFNKAAEMLSAAELCKLPPLERIAAFAWALIGQHKSNPVLLRLINTELTTPTSCFEEIVQPNIRRNFHFLCEAIREGIDNASIRRDLQPEYAALTLVGIINFYFLAKPLEQRLIALNPESDARYGQQAIEIFLAGIRRELCE